MNWQDWVSSHPKRVHRTRCWIIFHLCAKLSNNSEKISYSQKNTAPWSYLPNRKMNNLSPPNNNTHLNTNRVVMSHNAAPVKFKTVNRCTQLNYRTLSKICSRNSTHKLRLDWRLSRRGSWRKELFCRNSNRKAQQPHIWPVIRENTCGSKY